MLFSSVINGATIIRAEPRARLTDGQRVDFNDGVPTAQPAFLAFPTGYAWFDVDEAVGEDTTAFLQRIPNGVSPQ
jgi:hypothetical protein